LRALGAVHLSNGDRLWRALNGFIELRRWTWPNFKKTS
jgi:hypothetical protein